MPLSHEEIAALRSLPTTVLEVVLEEWSSESSRIRGGLRLERLDATKRDELLDQSALAQDNLNAVAAILNEREVSGDPTEASADAPWDSKVRHSDETGPPGRPDVPKGIVTEYPSGITSYVDWGFEGDAFHVKGQDIKPGGGDYEYFATIDRDHLPALADALGTDVTGIEAAWAAQIAEINTPGFTTWLRNHGIEFEFHTWGSFDWYE